MGIEELDRQDAADREAVFATYKAEFGSKSHTAQVIAAINKKAQIAKIREDAADREAVFAQYQAEFGTKSKTHHVIEELDRQDAADREAVFAQYQVEFGTKSHTMQAIHAARLISEQSAWEGDTANRSTLFVTVCS